MDDDAWFDNWTRRATDEFHLIAPVEISQRSIEVVACNSQEAEEWLKSSKRDSFDWGDTFFLRNLTSTEAAYLFLPSMISVGEWLSGSFSDVRFEKMRYWLRSDATETWVAFVDWIGMKEFRDVLQIVSGEAVALYCEIITFILSRERYLTVGRDTDALRRSRIVAEDVLRLRTEIQLAREDEPPAKPAQEGR